MTHFGTISAWMALVAGAALALLSVVLALNGGIPWGLGLAALLLLIGGYRALRQLSGGLRLLAGAWGLSAGLLLGPALPPPVEALHDTYYVVADGWLAGAMLALTALSLAGLALAVLHKERKG